MRSQAAPQGRGNSETRSFDGTARESGKKLRNEVMDRQLLEEHHPP